MQDPDNTDPRTAVGRALLHSKLWRLGEFAAVFAVAGVVIAVGVPLAGDNPLARQGVVWIANVLMLATVWLGLRLRGQTFEHFGLSLRLGTRRVVLWGLLKSLLVFAAAVLAFAVGAVVMANILGVPEPADMSGYNYLRGNLPLLILALVSIYFVSSFGEEVIYRGFLINRIAELGPKGKAPVWLAVVLSSVIFGLVHYSWGPAGMVQTGCMGLALGAAYLIVRRNLWVTILAHVYLDTSLIVPMYFAP